MGKIIKNFKDLATNQYRKDALDIVEAAYKSIDTENVIRKNIVIEGDNLLVQGNEYNLSEYENIYIIGFGKVSCKAAKILEEILGDRIKDGAVIGISDENKCNIIETFKGTHPLPSDKNVKASERLSELSTKATDFDLVIVIVGGGGSALLCSTKGECHQGNKLYKEFKSLKADIKEMNVIRKHISDIKGGGLAKKLYPATVVGLVFSDVPGDDCAFVASGPTYMDDSTVEDAQAILDKYGIKDFDLMETPKSEKYFEKIENVLLVSNNTALEAMESAALERGYNTCNIGAEIYLNQKDTARLFKKNSEPNTVCVAGGETELIIPKGCNGKGGRNDSMALMMMDHIQEDQVFISFASDGHDNTEAAGCIIDHNTKEDINNKGLIIEDYSVCLDTYMLFEKTGNLIFTGLLESNVSDLMLLLKHNKNG